MELTIWNDAASWAAARAAQFAPASKPPEGVKGAPIPAGKAPAQKTVGIRIGNRGVLQFPKFVPHGDYAGHVQACIAAL